MKQLATLMMILVCATIAQAQAGSDGTVQFNTSGMFGGSDNLKWENTTNRLRVGPAFASTTNVLLTVSGELNNYTNVYVINPSTLPGAGAGLEVGYDISGAQGTYSGLWHYGPGFSASGDMRQPNSGILEFQGTNGGSILATRGAIRFGTNGSFNTEMIFVDGRLGIGTTAPYLNSKLHIVQDKNGFAQFNVENPNTGSSARAGFLVGQNTATGINYGLFSYTGSGWTAVGSIKPKQLVIQALNDGGLNLLAERVGSTIKLTAGGFQDANVVFEAGATLNRSYVPIEATSFKVQSKKIIGIQCAAIPDADGANNTVILNQLLSCMRAHGLVAP